MKNLNVSIRLNNPFECMAIKVWFLISESAVYNKKINAISKDLQKWKIIKPVWFYNLDCTE